MKNNLMSANTTPKVRKIRIGFGILGAIVIVISAIACYLILRAPKSSASNNENQKYAAQWDEKYGNVPEGIKYDLMLSEGKIWYFKEIGSKGIVIHEGPMPSEEETLWLQRGREELKNANGELSEEALLAGKYDYLLANGNFAEGEPEYVRILGEALFDKKDSYTDEEWQDIHGQLAAAMELCSMDLNARIQMYGEP